MKHIYVVYNKESNKPVYVLDKFPIYADDSCNIVEMTIDEYYKMISEETK